MHKKTAVLLAAIVLAAALTAHADTIVLQSGETVEGTIVERSADMIKVDSNGVALPYLLSEVKSINGQAVQVPAPQPPQQPQAVTPALQQTPPATQPVTRVQVTPAPQQRQTRTQQLSPQQQRRIENTAKTAAAIFFGLGIFMYIFMALCLFTIAQKTQSEPAWLAWIPLANLFLMCKIGGLRYTWLWLVLAWFLPFIGLLAQLGLMGFLGYRIALARGKPGWLGALMAIPFVNIFILGYLAFSQ